jgi:DNA-binding NarL/FixJ family response regulator
MPKQKGAKTSALTEPLSAHDKIARLLGILAVKDKTESAEQVLVLQGAGFETAEIASMLGITENNINVIRHRLRNKKKRSKSSQK